MKTDSKIIKWDLSPLGKNDIDPQFAKDRKTIISQIDKFSQKWKSNNDYLSNSSILKEALDEYEKLYHSLGISGKEGYYFSLKHSLNQLDTKIKAKLNKVQEFGKNNQNKLLFFELSLSQVPSKTQKIFLESNQLSDYKHFLEKIFNESKYILSEKEEKIMNLRSTTARANWVKMTSTFLSKEEAIVIDEEGKEEKKTYSEIFPLLQSKEKSVRNTAAKALNCIFEKHSDVAEHEINSVLHDIKIVDQIRNIDRPDRMMHLRDDLDTKVVDTMIETIESNFSISKRYYKLKANLLNQKSLAYHERMIQYGNISKSYTYKQASNLIYDNFQNLDNEFSQIFEMYLNNGQIDVLPQKGKRGGAFCSHNLIAHPTYVFLNYTRQLDDVLTFAHEVGHGINNEMMRKKQNSLNFSTPLATAEIASTFFEEHILETLMDNADDETRLALYVKQVGDDVGTIIRQVSADLFQRELHKTFRENGYLSKDEIGKLFQKHMKAYMGPAVEQSPGSENWWIYWSHIRVPFYNYQYAFGLLIAKYFLQLVKEDKSNIEKFKSFLSAGSSESPRDIFLESGIDISDKSFWEAGIKGTEDTLNKTIKLANKLGKI